MAVEGCLQLKDAALLLGVTVFQSRRILHGGGVVQVGGRRCGSSEESDSAVFPEKIAALVGFLLVLAFKSVPFFVELSGEEREGGLPSFVCDFLPMVQKPGLKEAAYTHLLDEVDDFIVVCDDNAMVAAFNLAAVDLAGEGGDVGVSSVAPWSVEVRLDGNSFDVCDDEPCSEFAEHCFYRLVVIADIIIFELIDILLVGGSNVGLYFHDSNEHLKMVLHPAEFVVLL